MINQHSPELLTTPIQPESRQPGRRLTRVVAAGIASLALFSGACGGSAKVSEGVLGTDADKITDTNNGVQDASDLLLAAIGADSCAEIISRSRELRDAIVSSVKDQSGEDLKEKVAIAQREINRGVGSLYKAACHSDTGLSARAELGEARKYIENKVLDLEKQAAEETDDQARENDDYDEAQILDVKDSLGGVVGIDAVGAANPQSLDQFMSLVDELANNGIVYSEEDVFRVLCYDAEKNNGYITANLAAILSGYYPLLKGIVADNSYNIDDIYQKITTQTSGNEQVAHFYIQGLKIAADRIKEAVDAGKVESLSKYGCSNKTISYLRESLAKIAENFTIISKS